MKGMIQRNVRLYARFLLLFLCCMALAGCGGQNESTFLVTPYLESDITPEPTPEITPEPTEDPEAVRQARLKMYRKAEVNSKAKVEFSIQGGLYAENQALELKAEGALAIYYTLDGANPTFTSFEYTRPIVLSASHADLPKCIPVRAVAYYPDGTKSPVFTNSYFMDSEIQSRFSTLVFSVVGGPFDLLYGPNAILVGDNARKRGREMEREIYLQAFSADGEMVLSQTAGIRAYGSESRKHPIKSMKFYARKDYDKKNKTFAYDFFQTPRVRGGTIREYKRLVARNAGNDNQRAFIRDEFSQTMARKAGFLDSEGVRPVLIYMNGEYYGLHWLHETYCDDYFKAKYGDSEGEFVVVEGKEQIKSHTDEKKDDYQPEAALFQTTYEHLISLDLLEDANYQLVTEFIDVENYLDYFAYNIYINNWEWPQSNEKLYAYFPNDGKYGEGVRDGRWRFLIHDMDYSFDIYAKDYLAASYDMLKGVLTEGNEHYAPLFAKLMEREECRRYFVEKGIWLAEEVYQPDRAIAILEELDETRSKELSYYYVLLGQLRKEKDSQIWTTYSVYQNGMERIKNYLRERPAYFLRYLKEDLPLPRKGHDGCQSTKEATVFCKMLY